MAPDYAQLAKRISSYTSKCLLTAIVLVAGLGFGRQVLRWWAADESDSSAAYPPAQVPDGLGDPSQLHVMQFGGQPWSLRRQSISGDKRAASAALRASCRGVVREGRLPDDKPGGAENELLDGLVERDPVEREPGRWRLYELDEAFPMVIGTRPTAPPAEGSARKNLVGAGSRVVTWGLAVPAGPDTWTLCTFQPEPPAGGGVFDLPEIPSPPECTRTLSLRVAGGTGIVAFEGPRHAETWTDFYDRWFAGHNWKAVGRWRRSGSAWHSRYTAPGEDPAASVDVHFGADGRGRFTGVLMITPSPSAIAPG